MRIEEVVVNASPLITLFRSGQAELLPRLFRRIVVPGAVWQEVVVQGRGDVAARGLGEQAWVLREEVTALPRVAIWNLGMGETEVLSYALSHPSFRAVVDDQGARRCASTLGIRVLGTGGLLVLAKRRGILSTVEDGLERLRAAGLFLSDELVVLLKRQAGE